MATKLASVKLEVKLLDAVALTKDLPERGLLRGQVGTVVELLAPNVFEVEFSDDEGRTYASLALRASQLLVLHHQLVKPRTSEPRGKGLSRRRYSKTREAIYKPAAGAAIPVRESKRTP